MSFFRIFEVVFVAVQDCETSIQQSKMIIYYAIYPDRELR